MSSEDIERRRAAGRRHYRNHREEVIAKVTLRKHTEYGGVCRNCGGPTVGESNKRREWCAKPECASVQRQYLNRKGAMSEHRWAHNPTIVHSKKKYRAFCSCGWQCEWRDSVSDVLEEIRVHTGLKEREHRRPDGR
jgi:hypothetical protein